MLLCKGCERGFRKPERLAEHEATCAKVKREPKGVEGVETIPESVATLRTAGDSVAFDYDGFQVNVSVKADAFDNLLGVVVEIARHVKVTHKGSAWRTERDVVLGGSSLWGIDSLEDGYARVVCVDLLNEALAEALGVIEVISGRAS